jgi:DNA-binding IclR family transcriptional regulator
MPITPPPAVLRACDALEHLARHPGRAFSVSELARELGMPRATCDAVLLALAQRSLVDRRDPDRRYALGPACISLGEAARAADSLLVPVAPLAEAFARETRTCVALATVTGETLRVDRMFDHGPAFGARARVGESVPLIAPFGAVFVAWAPDAAVDQWLDGAGIADDAERGRYRAALSGVRARGLSIAVSNTRTDVSGIVERLQSGPGRPTDATIAELTRSEYLTADLDAHRPTRVNQLSAPVFDRNGDVAIQIMVLGPAYDLVPEEIQRLGDGLRALARQATERIGGVDGHASR